MNEAQQKEYERFREVPMEEASYLVVLRPKSYDTSVLFYKSKEDLEWALKNSWFDEKVPLVAKLIDIKVEVSE